MIPGASKLWDAPQHCPIYRVGPLEVSNSIMASAHSHGTKVGAALATACTIDLGITNLFGYDETNILCHLIFVHQIGYKG